MSAAQLGAAPGLLVVADSGDMTLPVGSSVFDHFLPMTLALKRLESKDARQMELRLHHLFGDLVGENGMTSFFAAEGGRLCLLHPSPKAKYSVNEGGRCETVT